MMVSPECNVPGIRGSRTGGTAVDPLVPRGAQTRVNGRRLQIFGKLMAIVQSTTTPGNVTECQ